MRSLEGIRKSIATAEELQSVVKTMKGVAAAGIRQFERAVASLTDYSRTVELALQVLLSDRPERLVATAPVGTGDIGAVVFGSDQGMCGRFNQQIADHAAEAIHAHAPPPGRATVLVVGARIVPLLEMAGLPPDEQVATASSLAGIAPLVQEILMRVEAWRSRGTVGRVVVLHNQPLGGAAYRPRTRQLFPVDLEWLGDLSSRPWPGRGLPMYTVGWDELFPAVIREFFYVCLFQASAESLASENASRLASMQAAERNIAERLDVLNLQFRLQRQQSITEELLDIVSGFEALSAETS